MKILIVLLVLALSAAKNLDTLQLRDTNLCKENLNVTLHRICNFGANFYKTIAELSGNHYTVSPCSIWIILAAIAEGSDSHMQQRLFKFLNLPNSICVRKNIYKLATRRLLPENNVNFSNTRAIVFDQGVSMNPDWYSFVLGNSLAEVLSSPIKKYPQIAGNDIRRIMHGALPMLNLKGNSVLLDVFEYNGLWATAFNEAVVQRAPFYDHKNQRIGAVDLMTMRKRVKVFYVREINANILELPVGANSLYRMIFALPVNGGHLVPAFDFLKTSDVFRMPEFLKTQETDTPIDVAIPMFTMTSEIDVRKVLEDVGMADIWTTPSATKLISTPPALPSSFIQRTTVTLTNAGVYPSTVKQEIMTIRHPAESQGFIANRPFVFGLYDKDYSCIMLSMYSKPTYT